MGELSGKIALVTGAGRGIGAAVAREVAQRGAHVALLARTTAEVEEVADAIADAGGTALPLAADVSQLNALQEAIARVEARFGPITILVNNAAIIGPIGPSSEIDLALWAQTIAVNLIAAGWATRLVLPGMLAHQWGRIVNVSSGAAQGSGIRRMSAYSVSKAGLDMLTRALAAELDDTGVVATSVYPGVVATEMQAAIRAAPESAMDAETAARFHDYHASGALLDSAVPARLIAALCGDAAVRWHGQIVRVGDEAVRALVEAGA